MTPETVVALRDASHVLYNSLDEAHNVSHGSRVAQLALMLQQQEGGDPSLVEAGAWLHQYHDNLDDLNELLNTVVPPDAHKAVFHIVEVCRPNKIHLAQSIEAKIVYDADAMDLLGPFGTMREFYCNVKCRNKTFAKAIEDTIEVQRLFYSTLQTPSGKEYAKAIHRSDPRIR